MRDPTGTRFAGAIATASKSFAERRFWKSSVKGKSFQTPAGAKRRCDMKIEQQKELCNPLVETKFEQGRGKARQRTCRGHPP
ncbi:hypothetical protein [Aurantiacibacter rhizosphaerae]|uniref:Uncharacterized protein n=1 Tax=Aurantiacibacter rhizosphaerae TaxID=2691582 RepID=A0A844XAY3_9SPHN|nr:hypothetical protein [Aurantiacibacter rhizosphaerae]MWV26939.1 hypothetical protein [Aurantiacibacter rhizosphaerae]